jgi:hypothetical protein
MGQMPRKVDRRQALAAFGTVSLGGLLAACGDDDDSRAKTPTPSGEDFDASATCVVTPELTEGPYYIDLDALRSDITDGRPGTPLALALRVRDAATCEPIENAVVDIWHCDAGGVYSGFEAGAGETFLRGTQVTNSDGVVRFKTIYPGWYAATPYADHAGRDVYNEDDGIYTDGLQLTLSKRGDGVRGVMTFDVAQS